MSVGDYIHPAWREAWQKVRAGFSPADDGPYVDDSDGTTFGRADLYADRIPGQKLNHTQVCAVPDGYEAVIEPHAEGGYMVLLQKNGQAAHGGWDNWSTVGRRAATHHEAVHVARDALKRVRWMEAERAAHPDKQVIR